MNRKKYLLWGLVSLVVTVLVLASTGSVFAQTKGKNRPFDGDKPGRGDQMRNDGRGEQMRPVVFGAITAINGSTLTVAGTNGPSTTTATTTYTVDASTAKITKAQATTTIASLAVGDKVMIQGTISGTLVTATIVHAGVTRDGRGLNQPTRLSANRGVFSRIGNFFGRMFGF